MNATLFVIAFGLCQCLGRRVVQLPNLQETQHPADLQNSQSADYATSRSLSSLLFALSGAKAQNRRGYEAMVPSRKLEARLPSRSSSPEMFEYEEGEITFSVNKPMGVAFEETDGGVFLSMVKEDGNGAKAGLKEGLLLLGVDGVDMRDKTLDGATAVLGNAPSDKPLSMTFVPVKGLVEKEAMLLVVDPDGSKKTLKTETGTLLRNALITYGFPVYNFQGNLMNCGGNGNCGLCVVGIDPDDPEEWDERSDVEEAKLKKYRANTRLSCQTIIEGDAAITLQPKQI